MKQNKRQNDEISMSDLRFKIFFYIYVILFLSQQICYNFLLTYLKF